MKADVFRRGRRAAAAWMGLPAAAALLAGCEPGAVGGYDKVVYRDEVTVPRSSFPDPPPVTPGASAGGTAARIVAANLPQGVTQEMVDQGQDLYGTVCAACHGQGGTGSAAAPPLNDSDWIHISGQFPEIVTIINNGVPNPRQYGAAMPPRGGGSFDDAQIQAISAYVYALSHQGGA